MSSQSQFVKADAPDKGKKFEQVTKMLDVLRKSDDPVPFDRLCSSAGAKYPQDVQAAMFSLELTGLVDRYTFTTEGSTRSHVAYAWTGGNGDRPTSAASSGSKKRSSTKSGSQAKAGRARQTKKVSGKAAAAVA